MPARRALPRRSSSSSSSARWRRWRFTSSTRWRRWLAVCLLALGAALAREAPGACVGGSRRARGLLVAREPRRRAGEPGEEGVGVLDCAGQCCTRRRGLLVAREPRRDGAGDKGGMMQGGRSAQVAERGLWHQFRSPSLHESSSGSRKTAPLDTSHSHQLVGSAPPEAIHVIWAPSRPPKGCPLPQSASASASRS